MKRYFRILLMSLLAIGFVSPLHAQKQLDADAIERELAVTAYNYAAGCANQGDYEEALEGLTHIPLHRLTAQQQGWADTLRMKCEAFTGHPMASTEIPLTPSEMMAIDDQSDLFLSGIRRYQAGDYSTALTTMTEVLEMGQGPREQVYIEALFWRGQCHYQLKDWQKCCDDIILFNDTKNEATDSKCDLLAYYTLGYARMQMKKWRQARINFSRYIEREKDKSVATYADAKKRLAECKQLEAKKSKSSVSNKLNPVVIEANSGETLVISSLLNEVYTQAGIEKQQATNVAQSLRNWVAPFIEQ